MLLIYLKQQKHPGMEFKYSDNRKILKQNTHIFEQNLKNLKN